jgi:tight adherence protein C
MSAIVPIIIVAAILLIVAITLVVIGMRRPRSADETLLEERLEEFSSRGEEVNLEKLELSQPFAERVIFPIARKLGELAARFTPQNVTQSLSRKIELAGNPSRVDPATILAGQFIIAAVFGGVLILVFTLGPSKPDFATGALLVLVFSFLGFYFPQLWLTSKIQKRQKNIRKAMPDALDLLTICVEAGLGFEAALAKVSDKWQTELSLAFARVIREIGLGKVRKEAMRAMSDNIGLTEMTSFVAAVIQSEALGVSMAKVLRIQSDQMRVKRRQLAEEAAHKAPLKMLIPMGMLIFPALCIVLMTPAILKLTNSALGSMLK